MIDLLDSNMHELLRERNESIEKMVQSMWQSNWWHSKWALCCQWTIVFTSSGIHPMQLTSTAVIVDYFPEAFVAEACEVNGMKVVIKRFNKRVTFRANGKKSYSTITFTNFKNEIASRIADGAEMTGYNTEKMPKEEYMPMVCWQMPNWHTVGG